MSRHRGLGRGCIGRREGQRDYAASHSASAPNSAHTLPKPSNNIRLSQARLGQPGELALYEIQLVQEGGEILPRPICLMQRKPALGIICQ
jgi:hypothetical protein